MVDTTRFPYATSDAHSSPKPTYATSVRRWLLLLPVCAALALSACSSARPWLNKPLDSEWQAVPTDTHLAGAPATSSAATNATSTKSNTPQETSSIIAAVTLSGGGARAAGFGLGVLRELEATRFQWEGRQTRLLDEVSIVSGVSGGSVLATYYAAFGDEVFTRFDRDFLMVNFQSSLIRDALSPGTMYKLTSPWYGRSNALSERLDEVFRGQTFGDLRARGGRPRLLVTATDLTTGAPFEFTPEQFALICSDLDSVPLSFAVAASSAVPILLSPVTVRNYAGSCPAPALPFDETAIENNLSARLLHMIAKSYRDAQERPYIHLVDGGVVDNLGVRGLLDRAVANGSLNELFKNHAPGTVRHIVLISVNSERDTADRIDASDRLPSGMQVLDAMVFGAGSRLTSETTAMVNDAARRMTEELKAERSRPGSPFAQDAEIHVISVSLRDVPGKDLRQRLLNVPTALTILPLQVRELEQAGRLALRASPAFQRLRVSLGVETQSLADAETRVAQ